MPFDALTLGNPQDGAPTLRLLGLDFADLTLPAVVARLAARPADAPFSYVVTPNADHLVRLARRPALRPLYHEAGLRLLDSRVVARLARLMACRRRRWCRAATWWRHLSARRLRRRNR
ncbi:hypothetical protein ACFQU2_07950 [Siccirubricoccus deserti]